MQQIEAFTAGGVVSGAVAESDWLHEGLETAEPFDVDAATWYPIAGGAAEPRARVHLEQDDLLVLCAETEDLPVHASWHAVELDIGPYHLTGELPTMPGFDPGRALSRPGGPFILLREVRVDLLGHPEGGSVERRHALVNRYAVEAVAADIELGYYFPGAHFRTVGGRVLS
jgi:hypothetical protein